MTLSNLQPSKYRWWVLNLLFWATTISYLDRIVLSFLAPTILADLHVSIQGYGYVTGAFSIAYMIGYIGAGRFIDWVGTRLGYAISITFWSIAAALHAVSAGVVSLGVWRSLLGIGESGNFPAAIKGTAEWFPKRDRAFATSLFNSGATISSIIGPPALVFINATFGWRGAFVIVASIGFIWLVLWMLTVKPPEQHPKVNAAELAYIHSDEEKEPQEEGVLSWGQVLRYRETWGFTIAKFLTDPVWWFFLWWLPLYLRHARKLSESEAGWAMAVVYFLSTVGSVYCGWVTGVLIKRGWATGRARKIAMAVCACLMPFAALAVFSGNMIVTILLVGVATAAHQGWSANLFTTSSDIFPKNAVASVVGIGGAMGGLGSALFSSIIPGYVIAHFGYKPAFIAMGCFHLIGLAIVQLLMRDMKPIKPPASVTA